jgi:chitin synthase
MYRLRTADKGKPLIISDVIVSEYSNGEVDTLHKKNLLSLGEDRFLTTLMTKHFPFMSYKFIPDAYASTAAPETWSVLLSQRRRWINSTIHNLAEMMWIKDMCGFCCFSMRFVVFIDLFGTIILPATLVYLAYLLYRVGTGTGQFPLISIIMIAGTYGLQALIFILKRQWQHVGWMIIYLLAFPVYSFILPVYSFWNQDNFTWGNTRIVVGEKGNKQIVAVDDEGFDPRSIPLQRWDDYAYSNNLPGRRGGAVEKGYFGQDPYADAYEMDEMRSMYSSVKPASTILTGFHGQNHPYMPPQSPAPFSGTQRQSSYTNPYTDAPNSGRHQSTMSLGGEQSPYHDSPRQGTASPRHTMRSTIGYTGGARSPLAGGDSRPQSTFDFQRVGGGPSDDSIIEAIREVLSEVDLDNVTKKQVRALVEQRLQTECVGERRTFLDRWIDSELANM